MLTSYILDEDQLSRFIDHCKKKGKTEEEIEVLLREYEHRVVMSNAPTSEEKKKWEAESEAYLREVLGLSDEEIEQLSKKSDTEEKQEIGTYRFLSSRLLDAINMAVDIHSKMPPRKGDGQPYTVHPIAVLGILIYWGADEDTCIAGLLHDAIEDTAPKKQGKLRSKIKEMFGDTILEIVEDVTEQDKSLSWKERKDLYLKHLRNASKQSLMVSCADRTHNSGALLIALKNEGETVWKRFNAPKEDVLWFFSEVRKIMDERLDSKFVHELHANIQSIQLESGMTGQAFADNLGRNVLLDVPTN